MCIGIILSAVCLSVLSYSCMDKQRLIKLNTVAVYDLAEDVHEGGQSKCCFKGDNF